MKRKRRPISILVAEDDPDDALLVEEALRESHLSNDLFFVQDGEDLMAYLNRQSKYATSAPRPGLILIDLNMPRKDGREALQEIKADPGLRKIPIVVLTASKAEEDILRSFNIGEVCFITKPVTFDDLVEVVKMLGKYWFEIVELPE